MSVSCIDTSDGFARLKTVWTMVYAADEHASAYLSWPWLRGWFNATTADRWFVLAYRPDDFSPYVAFLPLAQDHIIPSYRLDLVRVLRMGGSPAADYTGFICLPQYEEQALAAFATHIQERLAWDTFHMTDVMDPRLEIFLAHFTSQKFSVEHVKVTPCPYVSLPDNWEDYLQNFLGPKIRSDLRRSFRRIEGSGEFSVTEVGEHNFESHTETLLQLLKKKWGKSEYVLQRHRSIFSSCFEEDCLWLKILWHGSTPIAGLAAFPDRHKRVFTTYMTAHSGDDQKLSPGRTLYAYSIREAIEKGFRLYDFTRGNESYKTYFGTAIRNNQNVAIIRRSLRMQSGTVLRRLRSLFSAAESSLRNDLEGSS
jgi:CelD/BcsL family acetyltransferase involved in cellulose biosynthesis